MSEFQINENPEVRSTNPYSVDNWVPRSTNRVIEPIRAQNQVVVPRVRQPRAFDATANPEIRSLKKGLEYYYTGVYLVSFCFLLANFLRGFLGPQITVLASYGATLGLLIVLAGELKCLSVSRTTGGFRPIFMSVLFYSLVVLLHVIKYWVLRAPAFQLARQMEFISLIQTICGFFANYYFLTFVIRVVEFLDHQVLVDKARKIRNDIWKMIGFIVIVFVVTVVLIGNLQGGGAVIAALVLGIGAIAFVIMFYTWLHRFTRLVRETSEAILVTD